MSQANTDCPVLLNAHVWAYYQHHPIDPDHSLFALHAQGSLAAHHELLALLLHFLLRGYMTPTGLRQFALNLLEARARQLRADYAQWEKQQSSRISKAGRPSKKARALNEAQELEALRDALLEQTVIDPKSHRSALAILGQLSSKPAIARRQIKRGKRGQPPKNAERYEMAMQVWEALKTAEVGHVGAVIRALAECHYESEHPPDPNATLTTADIDKRENAIQILYGKYETAYYDLKPYLTGEAEPWLGGIIPLEKMFDE